MRVSWNVLWRVSVVARVTTTVRVVGLGIKGQTAEITRVGMFWNVLFCCGAQDDSAPCSCGGVIVTRGSDRRE